jgi:hypothetical protein
MQLEFGTLMFNKGDNFYLLHPTPIVKKIIQELLKLLYYSHLTTVNFWNIKFLF